MWDWVRFGLSLFGLLLLLWLSSFFVSFCFLDPGDYYLFMVVGKFSVCFHLCDFVLFGGILVFVPDSSSGIRFFGF